jgi:hypothetical protein
MGEHVPLLQVPPDVLGLPRQVLLQAPQLVALVFRFTCTRAGMEAGGQLALLLLACS